MRFRVFPYNFASEGASRLRDGLRAIGLDVLKVRRDGTYRYRDGDVIINWGNSTPAPWMSEQALRNTLNKPENVALASDKLRTLTRLTERGVPTIPFTTDAEVASDWDAPVYVRHVLNGHSGEGIEIFDNVVSEDTRNQVDALTDIEDRLIEIGHGDIAEHVRTALESLEEGDGIELPDAPLYTRKVHNNGEYRVHVFNGRVIDYRKKSRHIDDEPTPEQSNIRTLGNGWVYRQSNLRRLERIEQLALSAIGALGLDFGAVDIINDENNNAMVIEVNTAVGADSVTTNSYVTAFSDEYAT